MRIRWMDAYRGAAILLVVLQHSTGIPRIAGIELHLPLIEAVTALLAPYRMPTLLVLSGLLLAPSLNKPLREYYDGKARRLLHPYVVWGVVTAAASFSLTSIFTIEFWRGGPTHLWFLTVLMISYAFAPIGRWLRMPHLLVAAGLMATLLIVDPSTNFYRRAIFRGSLFYVGAAVRPHISRIQTLGRWFPATMGAVGVGVAIASLLGYVWVDHSIPLSALWLIPWSGCPAVARSAPTSMGVAGSRRASLYRLLLRPRPRGDPCRKPGERIGRDVAALVLDVDHCSLFRCAVGPGPVLRAVPVAL